MPANADAGDFTGISFILGQQQPLCSVLDALFLARRANPYAWYVRVPDLSRFLWRIAPVLERRLACSPLAGYTGGLKLDLQRSILRLVFDQGRLLSTENLSRSVWMGPEDASFPPLVFLQLLMGHRSHDELFYAFPDVQAKDDAALMLKTLFPRQPSYVLPLG